MREKHFKCFVKKARAQNCSVLSLGSSSVVAVVALVDCDMLTHVWDEMNYRRDVCRVTKDGHIEHL
jgi:hypothetical protein